MKIVLLLEDRADASHVKGSFSAGESKQPGIVGNLQFIADALMCFTVGFSSCKKYVVQSSSSFLSLLLHTSHPCLESEVIGARKQW